MWSLPNEQLWQAPKQQIIAYFLLNLHAYTSRKIVQQSELEDARNNLLVTLWSPGARYGYANGHRPPALA